MNRSHRHTAAALLAAALLATPFAQARVLDDFEDLSPWTAEGSDDVAASLRHVEGSDGRAMCLDFDFGHAAGYAIARRELPIVYPDDYELRFDLRGDAAANHLQLKLVDASGENVWWVNRPDTVPPRDWQPVRYRKRHVDFAWGPTADKRLVRTASIELAVAAGSGGGTGSVCIDSLSLVEREPLPSPLPKPSLQATAGADATAAMDGDATTVWRVPADADDAALTIDLGVPREFGGLVLYWRDGARASAYDIGFSDDGERWRTVREVRHARGGDDPLLLTESEARYLRVSLADARTHEVALAEIELKPLAFGDTANTFFEALAEDAPRGAYPRGFSGQQTYWTVVGVDGGSDPALMSEDGAIELGIAAPSVEPMLRVDGRLLTWADVEIAHALQDGYLPMPRVSWTTGDVALDVRAFAEGDRDAARLVADYTLRNTGERPREVELVLAIRPFQVNPPVQFLNTAGGVSPIHRIARDDGTIAIGDERIVPLAAPDRFVAAPFDAGRIDQWLDARDAEVDTVSDDTGFASAALVYRWTLAPGQSRRVAWMSSLAGEPQALSLDDIDARREAVAKHWRDALDRVRVALPDGAPPIADTLRTALAHILINRDGPAIQPGTRSYRRSWIRDGAMTSGALMRLGHAAAAAEFLEWYAPYQFDNGKVPCCVDRRGADPVPENDSHGELVHLIAELDRYDVDRGRLQRMWPHVDAAVRYMDTLRASERTDANRTPERRAYFGLMPPSISHEGYSARPAYSYWDDFWALLGYKDAVDIARRLGRDADARRIAASRDAFARDLYASIDAAMARYGIDHIPGAADRGDFDATSTTIALAPGGETTRLPQPALDNTFQRYWRDFVARRDGRLAWEAYTPYELRVVGTFARLGWRERALEALDFFFDDRRPAAWNQWAEVVGRDPREPRFIGDMPHGWVASDYIRSALDLFAYRREADDALVIGAGVAPAWLEGDGVRIERLRTPYGRLDYTLRRAGDTMTLDIGEHSDVPPGGFVLDLPMQADAARVTLGGKPLTAGDDGDLRVRNAPAVIAVELAPR